MSTAPSDRTPHRIFLVDDHPVIRQGLRQLFEDAEGFAVVGEARNGDEALSQVEELSPDLALVDVTLGSMGGIELVRHLSSQHPGIQVLIFSAYDDAYYVRETLNAGAEGYVLKDKQNEILLEAAQTVLQGRQYLDAGVQTPL